MRMSRLTPLCLTHVPASSVPTISTQPFQPNPSPQSFSTVTGRRKITSGARSRSASFDLDGSFTKEIQSPDSAAREAKVLRKLHQPKPCPRVPQLLEQTPLDGGAVALKMTSCPGVSMDQILAPEGMLATMQKSKLCYIIVVSILSQVQATLRNIHKRSCAHRDLHPGNILVHNLKQAITNQNPYLISVHIVDFGESLIPGKFIPPGENALTTQKNADRPPGKRIYRHDRDFESCSPKENSKKNIHRERHCSGTNWRLVFFSSNGLDDVSCPRAERRNA